MYFPRGIVHQAVTDPASHSLHLTFSTYQRHTFCDLLADAAVKLPKATAACNALRTQPGPWHENVPRNLLETPSVGYPEAAWPLLRDQIERLGLPARLEKLARKPGVLGCAVDARALCFLRDSLPPPPFGSSDSDFGGDQVAKAAGVTVGAATTLRLRAPLCARLVDEARLKCDLSTIEAFGTTDDSRSSSHGTGGTLSERRRGGGGMAANKSSPLPPRLLLYTNTSNSRALAGPASNVFEVLPHLASSVLKILDAGVNGVKVREGVEEMSH
eukprot:UC1_evm1s441